MRKITVVTLSTLAVLGMTAIGSVAHAASTCYDPTNPMPSIMQNMGKPIYDTYSEEMNRSREGGPLLRQCDPSSTSVQSIINN